MYNEYSIKDKLNFLQKIKDDIIFKQKIMAKNLPENFRFMHEGQLHEIIEGLQKAFKEGDVEELSESAEAVEMFNKMVNAGIHLANLCNANMTTALVSAQVDLIDVTTHELFSDPGFQENITKNVRQLIVDAYSKGVSDAVVIATSNDAMKSAKDMATQLITDESLKKSQQELMNSLISISNDSVMKVFIPVLENIISNITQPDSAKK